MARKVIDLTSKKFGRLTVLGQHSKTTLGMIKWLCLCDCGKYSTPLGCDLKRNRIISCGCYKKERGIIDLIGKRFGRLVVLKYIGKEKINQNAKWLCQCDCGKIKEILGASLKDKKTMSCGCYNKEKFTKVVTKHGSRFTLEYQAWINMKSRCYNIKCKEFPNYGGRVILVCDEWINSPQTFLKDMGKKPTPKHSLDRFPDMNGNYELSNCRWATSSQQNSNRRNNHWEEFNGERLIVKDWAIRFNISGSTLSYLLKTHKIEDLYIRYIG